MGESENLVFNNRKITLSSILFKLRMKKSRVVFTLLTAFLYLNFGAANAQSPYERDTSREIGLSVGSAGLAATGLYLNHNIVPLTEEQVNSLSKEDLNSLDRWVTNHWSPRAGKWSDILRNISLVSPFALLASDRIRDDAGTVGLMYAEALLLSSAGTLLSKAIFQRTRPFVYNPDVPMRLKAGNKEARRSFYSGHAATTFTSGFFLAKVFGDFYPDSDWKPVIWGGAVAISSTVALLRMLAGKHFLTDVLGGAVMGGLIGYGVPAIHEKTGSKSPSSGEFIISMTIRF
jgi:membrane-associated phospholipid phosphatase